MFLPNDDSLKFYTPDLVNTYLTVFCRFGLFGLKIFTHEDYEWKYFILRARFLLATIPDEHIEALFKLNKQDATKNPWAHHQREALVTACWVSGLLKKRQFLPQIKEAILTANDHIFFSPAWLPALALYQEESLIPTIQTYIDQNIEPHAWYRNAAHQAIEVLRLWDRQHQTNYAKAYQQYQVDKHSKKQWRNVLKVSEIIRANIDFTHSWELQQKLKVLLEETTTPTNYCHGFLTSPTIRTYAEGQQAHASWWWHLEKKKALYWAGKPINGFDKKKKQRNSNALMTRKSHRFENFVRQYIQNPQRAAYLPELTKEALLVQDLIDILAALEIDIAYGLPTEVIEICYQKLFKLLPNSAFLYESYALALLMRGNTYDQKAAKLYEKAQAIKAKYIWEESVWGGWVRNPVRYK